MSIAFAVVAMTMLGGCDSPAEMNAVDATRESAATLGVRIGNSDRLAHYANMTTVNVTQATLDEGVEIMTVGTIPPEKPDSIYEWTLLVVRLHGIRPGLFGTVEELTTCWEYVFEGRFLIGKHRPVDCPDGEPLTIEPVDRAEIPANALERMADVLAALPPGDAGSAAQDAMVQEFVDLGGAQLDVAVVGNAVGVTITDGQSCAMARRTPDGTIDVWMAQSADAITEGATCPASNAIDGYFQ